MKHYVNKKGKVLTFKITQETYVTVHTELVYGKLAVAGVEELFQSLHCAIVELRACCVYTDTVYAALGLDHTCRHTLEPSPY